MAKDSKSTFQIIDDEGYVLKDGGKGPCLHSSAPLAVSRVVMIRPAFLDLSRCPVDPAIFPGFTPDGNALQSIYEAFRFTESYGVIFQCNVKYCLGPCEPVSEIRMLFNLLNSNFGLELF